MLSEYGTSLPDICIKIESAENKDELKLAFARLNKVLWTMSLTAPLSDETGIISKILKELRCSDKLGYFLMSAPTPHQAILEYKTAIVEELAERVDNLEKFTDKCNRFEADVATHKSLMISHQVFCVLKMFISLVNNVLRFFFGKGRKSIFQVEKAIYLGTQRVRKLLSEYGTSLPDICIKIESAENKDELKLAFARLNKVLWTMSLTAPLSDETGIISKILKELRCSDKLGYFLMSAPTPHQAILEYKTAIVEELAERVDYLKKFTDKCNRFEADLFSKYFAEVSFTTLGAKDPIYGQLAELSENILSPCRKRKLSRVSADPSVEYAEMGPGNKSSNNDSTSETLSHGRKKRRYGFSSY